MKISQVVEYLNLLSSKAMVEAMTLMSLVKQLSVQVHLFLWCLTVNISIVRAVLSLAYSTDKTGKKR